MPLSRHRMLNPNGTTAGPGLDALDEHTRHVVRAFLEGRSG